MKPDTLSGQLNANTVPNFTSLWMHWVLCQEDMVDAERGREGLVESKKVWESPWSRARQPVREPAPQE